MEFLITRARRHEDEQEVPREHESVGSTRTESLEPKEPPLRDAAVLVPLYRDAEGDLRLVLIRRTERGIHGGQLAFPGGKRDPEDPSLLETALREVAEEIGLERAAINVRETLAPFETRTTGFRIHPFLARIERPVQWVLAADEIAEVIEPRLADLGIPEAHGEEDWQLEGWPEPYRIAFYRIGEHKLWGASYRIFHPLLRRLIAGEWEL